MDRDRRKRQEEYLRRRMKEKEDQERKQWERQRAQAEEWNRRRREKEEWQRNRQGAGTSQEVSPATIARVRSVLHEPISEETRQAMELLSRKADAAPKRSVLS